MGHMSGFGVEATLMVLRARADHLRFGHAPAGASRRPRSFFRPYRGHKTQPETVRLQDDGQAGKAPLTEP